MIIIPYRLYYFRYKVNNVSLITTELVRAHRRDSRKGTGRDKVSGLQKCLYTSWAGTCVSNFVLIHSMSNSRFRSKPATSSLFYVHTHMCSRCWVRVYTKYVHSTGTSLMYKISPCKNSFNASLKKAKISER